MCEFKGYQDSLKTYCLQIVDASGGRKSEVAKKSSIGRPMSSTPLFNATVQVANSSLQDERVLMNSSKYVTKSILSPTGCIVLRFDEYIPWNNPDNIVSADTEDIMYSLQVLLFVPVLFLIACPANIINMIVFYKHGLKERINVCLFALSLADEVYMTTNIVWYADQFYLRFTTKEKLGPVLAFLTNNHLIGLHGYIWVSQILSAIIAIERCLCVLWPLRSQTILPTSRMSFIVVVVHVVILSLAFFEMLRYSVTCAIDPLTGRIISTPVSSEIYFRYQKTMDYLDIFVFGLGLPGLVMIVLVTTTAITTTRLRQAAMWRAGSSTNGGLSERDIALTKMLIVNSVFFIVCLIPFIAFRFVFLFMPEVNAGGRQHNFYLMTHEILIIISLVNSTFNFVIYYTMGSRYRQTFCQLFGRVDKQVKSREIKL